MASLNEAANAITQFGPNVAGYEQLSRDQTVTFTQYQRIVLPLDGYVFWFNTQATFDYAVSIHFSADARQNEDEFLAVNRIVVTASEEIQQFNDIAPNTIWIGAIDGVRFAFSQRAPFYESAGLYHYAGDAVYPAMLSQLVDSPADLPSETPIVSNSLPAWLYLQSYNPVWLHPTNPNITLYPSFAVPLNLEPPYGSVHIEPSQTRSLQTAPLIRPSPNGLVPYPKTLSNIIGPSIQHTQLATDHVRVTLYGVQNADALAWVDLVNSYSYDFSVIGMMNMPIMRDGKRPQAELGILAMQKTIEFDVSYFQSAMWNVALQLILSALVTVEPNPNF